MPVKAFWTLKPVEEHNIMSNHSRSGKIDSARQLRGVRKPVLSPTRRLAFENLESRRLLSSVGLNSISNITLPAGTSYLVALNGSDPTSGKTVNFQVTSSNPTQVTPVLMPQTNTNIQFNIANLGSMTFQLFDNLTPNTAAWIEKLVNAGFYNGDYIYRAETGSFALIQGGNNPPQINNGANVNPWPSSFGTKTTINEEFNPDLNYTAPGTLAMARESSPNTSSSEFFVTDGATRSLDYGYTLFGFQTGDHPNNGSTTPVLQALDAETTTANSQGIHYLDTPVQITSASVITDTQDGVLMLRAPTGATGTFTVTVTAYDGTNSPTTQTFTVTVAADTTGNPTNPWTSNAPAAPTSVQFQPQSGQGTAASTTANNSSTSNELQFLVSGVASGNLVTLYADGVAIGSATANSTSVVVTTNGTTTLSFGSHTFTATQTVPNVTVTDSSDTSTSPTSETAGVDSYASAGVQVQVSFGATSSPSKSAEVGQPYTYVVETNAPSGDTVTVTPGTLPSGMQYDTTTQTFTWTPSGAQIHTSLAFSAALSDSEGNTASIGPINISVAPPAIEISPNTTLGGSVTVTFYAGQVAVFDKIAGKVLESFALNPTDTVEVDCPPGQANRVQVVLPSDSTTTLPQSVLVKGLSGSTNNWVIVSATAGTNNFTVAGIVAGTTTVTADGLATQTSGVQTLTLTSGSGNDSFHLGSSGVPLGVADSGSNNTLDFSQDSGGVTVSLGLDQGQAQTITPWSTTLAITGVFNYLTGSNYADALTGGPAALTEIRGGLGNDTITGGSGNNILVGGGGTDTITGGQGKNLIVGGTGNSSLYAKGAGNIIFAGSTGQDSNDQALLSLMDQPSQVTYGYSVRRILASAASTRSQWASTAVAFEDTGATDKIFGSGADNWFLTGKNTTVEG